MALRERATRLRAEAAKREGKTADLLRQLEAWEGVAYLPAAPATTAPTVRDGTVGGAPSVVLIPTPKTELLRIEAADLERQAAALEGKQVVDSGAIHEANSVEELVALVSTWAPEQIAPTLASVEAWATRVEAEQRERIQRLPFSHMRDAARVRFALAWTNGAVDEQSSTATLSHDQGV